MSRRTLIADMKRSPNEQGAVRGLVAHRRPLRLPLLITGIAGVPGFNALPYFLSRYPGQVVGLRQGDNERLAGPDIIACNAEDRDGLARVFDTFQFGSVLNCAGACALRACELAPELAWRINVDGVKNLLDVIGNEDVRLVHLSVDMVYPGREGGQYVETDEVAPIHVYGKTMAAAEQLLLSQSPHAALLRIALPMGISSNGHAGAIDWIQSRFKKHRPATLYYDEVRSPSYTDCLNATCEAVLETDLAGVFHAGGARSLSLYNIGQIINRIGGYDPRLLMGCPRVEAGPIPPRVSDVSMNSNKLAEALGFQPLGSWPYDERLMPTHDRWHHEREPGERGSLEYLAEVLYRNPLRLQQ